MLVATLLAALALAQPSSNSPLAPEPNGMHRADPTFVALANCTAHPEPGQTLAHATIVFRDGRIVEILPGSPGPDGQANTADDVAAPAPAGARVVDCTGLHAYAAFIEPYLEIDAPKPAAAPVRLRVTGLLAAQRQPAVVAHPWHAKHAPFDVLRRSVRRREPARSLNDLGCEPGFLSPSLVPIVKPMARFSSQTLLVLWLSLVGF